MVILLVVLVMVVDIILFKEHNLLMQHFLLRVIMVAAVIMVVEVVNIVMVEEWAVEESVLTHTTLMLPKANIIIKKIAKELKDQLVQVEVV